MPTLHHIAAHRMTLDGDWAEIVCDGPFDIPVITEIHALLTRLMADNAGRCFLLADITRLAGIPPEVRRRMAAWNAEHRMTAAAAYGGSFAMRTILTLTVKAIRFKDRDQVDVLFARDEAEARSWLAAYRARTR